MTWHHVMALLIAAAIVIACGYSPTCATNMGSVMQLATAIVAGVFGHAGIVHKISKREETKGVQAAMSQLRKDETSG